MFETILDPTSPVTWVIIVGVLSGAVAVISRPFSTYIKFVYPNAKYEAIGNPYILTGELDKLVECKNIEGFKEMLNTNRDYQVTGENIYDIQKSLDDHLIRTIIEMKKDSSEKMKHFYDAFLEKIDMSLVKQTVKKLLRGVKVDEKTFENAYLEKTRILLQRLAETDPAKVAEMLKKHGLPAEIEDVLKDEKIDFLRVDQLFDVYIINRFKQTPVPYKCENGKNRFIGHYVDILNIKNLLRGKQLGFDSENCKKLLLGAGLELPWWRLNELTEADSVPQLILGLQGSSYYDSLKNRVEDYSHENTVQVLENALDRSFLMTVKNISTENYVTIGPTIRFLVSKEFETRNLKTIVKGIGENLPVDVIKKNLVIGG